jgi:hypothetical protein
MPFCAVDEPLRISDEQEVGHDVDLSGSVVTDFLSSMPDLLFRFLAGVVPSDALDGAEDFGMIGLSILDHLDGSPCGWG